VYAHRLECPVIEAGAPMLRPDPATLRFPWTLMAAALPSQAPADAVKTPVYARLEGGETLNVAGGLHVLHTPGHAPGHLAFWLPEMRTLITGDVFFHTPGVQPPFAAFTPDRAENARSAHRLAELPAERVLFGHGLPILRGGQAALRASLHRFAVR
jgi:glyoxylase-like metal-dependent hydrolase (beta-lactamase superfamily II)